MNLKKLTVYFVIPLGTSMALIACYVSGIRLLETIVAAPYFEAVQSNSRREFGLLENLQAALILSMSVIAFRTAYLCGVARIRQFIYFVGACAALLFLEEIDYGMHFYDYLMKVPLEETVQMRNLHNKGDTTLRLKQTFDAITLGFFVVAPLFVGRFSNPNIRYLVPDRYSILTALAAVITRNVAHFLDDRGMGYGLQSNIYEFREVVTYYIMFLWVCQLARTGPLREETSEEPAPPSE